jgi:hypothetical protein
LKKPLPYPAQVSWLVAQTGGSPLSAAVRQVAVVALQLSPVGQPLVQSATPGPQPETRAKATATVRRFKDFVLWLPIIGFTFEV